MNQNEASEPGLDHKDFEKLKIDLALTSRILEECLVEIHELRSNGQYFSEAKLSELDIAPYSGIEDLRKDDQLLQLLLTPLRETSSQLRNDQVMLEEHIEEIHASGLFDELYYRETYADVSTSGSDPLTHYLSFGAAEGRDPSPTFSTLFYLSEYSDIAVIGINPLLHFIRCGQSEGRLKHPSEKLN